MIMFLTCAKCWHGWTVKRWTPAAMRCPHCGSEKLSDGVSGIMNGKDRELAAAKQKESERLARVEQQLTKSRT